MKLKHYKSSFFGLVFLLSLFSNLIVSSQEDGVHEIESAEEEFNPQNMIIHHVLDAHEFHIIDWNQHPISIPLPVILWTDKGLTTFMSSEFHHDDSGNTVVNANDGKFVKLHEKIYQLDVNASAVKFDAEGHPTNASIPTDISITRNVFMMWISVLVLLLIFMTAARRYRKSENNVPSGIAGFVEPLIVFVRDEIGIPMIGENKYKKYMPYLLTIFFFIWINNIFGLIPILNGANLSGNIAFTFTLAVFTFIITTFSGNKNYWKHIFWMPGVPIPMKIFLAPIEIIGMFVKPISLMIRLFANITAGHMVILIFVSFIFIFGKSGESIPGAVGGVVGAGLLTLFMMAIELVVAFVQAFVFTILTASYIGAATEEHHHDDAHAH